MKTNKSLVTLLIAFLLSIFIVTVYLLMYEEKQCIDIVDNFDEIGIREFEDFKYFNLQLETHNNWSPVVNLEKDSELNFTFSSNQATPKPFENKVERIQTNLYSFTKRPKWIQNSFMFEFSEDLLPVLNSPIKFRWLTIFELWNDPGWINSSLPYRLSLNLIKNSDSNYLSPVLSGQYKDYESNTWKTLWKDKLDVEVTAGIKYKFLISLDLVNTPNINVKWTDLNNDKTIQLNIDRALEHPDSSETIGFWGLNPIKLYTGSRVLDAISQQQGKLSINFSNVQTCYKHTNIFN